MTPEQANDSERRYLTLDHAAGYHDASARVNCPTCEDNRLLETVLGPVPIWHNTRRGTIGVMEVRTPRPSGAPDLVSYVWVTSTGATGQVDDEGGCNEAVALAYVALCRPAEVV